MTERPSRSHLPVYRWNALRLTLGVDKGPSAWREPRPSTSHDTVLSLPRSMDGLLPAHFMHDADTIVRWRGFPGCLAYPSRVLDVRRERGVQLPRLNIECTSTLQRMATDGSEPTITDPHRCSLHTCFPRKPRKPIRGPVPCLNGSISSTATRLSCANGQPRHALPREVAADILGQYIRGQEAARTTMMQGNGGRLSSG